jgi:hypothetical protein
MWMKPPMVYELTRPKSQSTSKITNIVQSIGFPYVEFEVEFLLVRFPMFPCAYRRVTISEFPNVWYLLILKQNAGGSAKNRLKRRFSFQN